MRLRHALLLPAVIVMAMVQPAAGSSDAILHERIAADPHDDIAMGVVVEGNIPAALETRSGTFSAPDPSRPPSDREAAATHTSDSSVGGTFTPDRNTARPDVLPYDDPFSPSTAPFKRLVAYDAVAEDFSLYVASSSLVPVSLDAKVGPLDERFYGDIVVDASTTSHVRLPTVGPGTRLVHARFGVGSRDVPFRIVRDGAENWFLDASETVRGRLVVDLAIPRAAYGGDFGDPRWEDLPGVPAVPPNVANAAGEVTKRIGVSRLDRPRDVIGKLVTYFRSFQDSEEPPKPEHDIYTDLALAKKGVCRHRSFAFVITALSMGIPSRMVTNEAHAWVEVNDGTLWKRIDLGGAGRFLNADTSRMAEPYVPPADPFAWPPNATRGDDMSNASRTPNDRPKPGGPSPSGTGSNGSNAAPSSSNGASSSSSSNDSQETDSNDARPRTTLTAELTEPSALRGAAIHLKGTASSDGEACPHLPVDVVLRDGHTGREARVGGLATDDKGEFSGAIVLPPTVSLGDYSVLVRTGGDARCGEGTTR